MVEKSNNNQRHVRDTLSILLSKMNHKEVKLLELISTESDKIKCSKILAFTLYERMLIKSLSSTTSYNNMDLWMPKGAFGKLGTPKVFKEWLISNEYVNDMNGSDMLYLGSITGWLSAWRFLIKIGLVRITRSNRIRIEYPVSGKKYSLDYAGMKMRGLLKKNKVEKEKPSLDIQAPDSVSSQPKEVIGDNFWEEK